MKLILCSVVVVFLFSGCHALKPTIPGSGFAQSEHRQVAPFNEISLSGFGTVNVIAGQQQSVQVTTDDNLLPCVETDVENGKLRIGTTRNIRPSSGLVVNVTVPELAAAKVSGAGDINLNALNGQQLDLSISGAGDLRANGQVKNISTKISGSGSADLEQLVVENAKVKISGAGDVDLFATESLDVRVSGAGSVNCFGNPSDVRQHVSGAGSVHLR